MSLLKRIEKMQEPQQPISKLEEVRLRRQPIAPVRDAYRDLKDRIHAKLIQELDPKLDVTKPDEVRRNIEELYNTILAQEGVILNRAERARLFDAIVSEIIGLGPIDPLLKDESITEIMVNGPNQIFIERQGKIEKTTLSFESNDHLMRIIDRIVSTVGRRVDESQPMVDARLPDGSRVNAIIPPLAIRGPTVTIRKFFKNPLTAEKLIEFGSITPEAIEFLKTCVQARLNILVSGGTGAGKTTLLNILSGYIPDDERIVTIENAAELQLRQEHVVTLESRPPNIEGKGEITIRDLVVNSLRMRPDRIIVGEVRAGEALEMLQAMNTGHDGSLGTLHANSPRDALARLETMTLMAGLDLPLRAIREQIAAALDLIVHQERMKDGSRKVVQITEVQGMEGDVIVLSDIFKFEHMGYEEGKVLGRLKPTGMRPKFMEKITAAGLHLPPDIFGLEPARYR